MPHPAIPSGDSLPARRGRSLRPERERRDSAKVDQRLTVGHNAPVLTIEPVYLAVGGALMGVVITLSVQSVLARINRLHDKMIKTYEIRLNLYTDIEAALEKIPEARRRTEEALEATCSLRAEREVHSAAINDLTSAVEALVAGAPTDSAERRKIKEQGEQKIEEARKHQVELGKLREQGKRELDRARESFGELESIPERLLELLRKVTFLAGAEVMATVAVLIERVAKHEEPLPEENTAFAMAVRKELGG